jgi:hypothetical protein
MNRLEKLIRDMQRQLFPYHHEHDIERGGQRWEVEEGEYIASWIAEQIRNCQTKNRCTKRGRCAFYTYSDLAKRNYEVCYEVLLRIENGDLKMSMEDHDNETEET